MGSVERRERQREELKSSILDAARALFVRDGFEAVTMRRIAEAIEYSATAIYMHFRDKEALLHELCERDLADFNSAISAAAGALVGLARLQATAKAYVTFAVAHPAQYRLLFMVPRVANAAAAEGTAADRKAYGALRDVFASLVGADMLRPACRDPDLLAQVYFCGLHGIVAAAITLGSTWAVWHPPQEQATIFVESLIHGIAKDPPHEHPSHPSSLPPQS